MTKIRATKRGFTLIEVLVALGIAVIMFTLLFVPMISAMDSTSQAQTRNELQRNAQALLSRMTSELLQAVEVYPNDAPRMTAVAQVNIAGNPTLLQVASTNGFEAGMTVTQANGNTPAVIADISESSNDVTNLVALFPRAGATAPGVNFLLLDRQLPANSYMLGEDVLGPFPYVNSANRGTAVMQNRVSLSSRLDFILPRGLTRGTGPELLPSLTPETATLNISGTPVEVPVVVTYYVRKRDNALPYHPADNPLLLYRAQYVPRLGLGTTLQQRLNNGCWRVDSINFEDTRGAANDFGCDPFANEDATKGAIVLDPAVLRWSSHNTVVPVTDVDLVGRCLDGSDPTDPQNPDCTRGISGNGSRLVSDTDFVVHKERGRTRVTIDLHLGRYDRGKSKFHRVQVRTDVDVNNSKK